MVDGKDTATKTKPLISKENAQNRPETIQRETVLGVSAPKGAYERVSYSGQLYAESNKEFVQTITDSSHKTEKTYSYDDIKKMTE